MLSHSETTEEQLIEALEDADFTDLDLTLLSMPANLELVRKLIRGTHHLVETPQEARDRFVVGDHFRVGMREGVEIGYVNDLFTERHGDMVEESQPDKLLPHKASKKGMSKERSFAWIWSFMKKHGMDVAGNKLEQSFWVHDKKGELCPVRIERNYKSWAVSGEYWAHGGHGV